MHDARPSVELRNKTKLHLNATNTVLSTVRNFFRAIAEIRRTQNVYIVHEEALCIEQTAPFLYVILIPKTGQLYYINEDLSLIRYDIEALFLTSVFVIKKNNFCLRETINVILK